MTAIGALVARSRRLLVGTQRDDVDFLQGAIVAGDGTLSIALGNTNITVGTYIEIDYEPMLVTAVAGSSLTVKRAMDGSTAASHADGALIRVNPTFTSWDLFSSMQEELSDLSSPQNGLFRVVAVEVTPGATPTFYDLAGATDPMSILKIMYEGGDGWHEATGELVSGWNTLDFPSTEAIRFIDFGFNMLHRILLRCPYAPITTGGSSVESESGLATTATNILPVGAAFRMAVGRELARSMFDRQGDTRRAEEVPPGAQRQGLTPFAALRQEMISAERARLLLEWYN